MPVLLSISLWSIAFNDVLREAGLRILKDNLYKSAIMPLIVDKCCANSVFLIGSASSSLPTLEYSSSLWEFGISCFSSGGRTSVETSMPVSILSVMNPGQKCAPLVS